MTNWLVFYLSSILSWEGRTLTLRTATMLLHTSTPPTNSAWMPSLSKTCLKSDRRGSLINTDWCPEIWRESETGSNLSYKDSLFTLLDADYRNHITSLGKSFLSGIISASYVGQVLCTNCSSYLGLKVTCCSCCFICQNNLHYCKEMRLPVKMSSSKNKPYDHIFSLSWMETKRPI